MATVTGLTLEQAKAKVDQLKAQGKNESTSKEVGKLVNYIKTLEPQKYGQKTVASAQQALKTSTQVPQVASQQGMTSQPGLSTSGGIDLTKIYDTARSDPELLSLENQLKEKQMALDTARSTINDNPYFSEATRVGRIQKLESKANSELSTLSNLIAQKKADADVRVNLATKQYDINNREYQKNLERLNMLLSSGALMNANDSDVASVATATGFTTGQIKGMVDKMRRESAKPQVVTDNAGNITAFDANTGQILYTLGGIGKADKDTSDTGVKKDKISDKDIGKGISILREVDVMNAGTEDKLLSGQEIQEAYSRLLAEYGNPDTAKTILMEAINRGKYEEWRG